MHLIWNLKSIYNSGLKITCWNSSLLLVPAVRYGIRLQENKHTDRQFDGFFQNLIQIYNYSDKAICQILLSVPCDFEFPINMQKEDKEDRRRLPIW
ncbi:hypothetical protein AVEN_112663-1 [Araneus ventricosus]|uniref:Uncharacterized protein n=1 Tax=Araneus ventricosus TaxID=182803 RepID=A0A4Y2KTN5_ARAVE|nr:hypothetical protein AVEN_112663-1 [Araneus ventricosus]